MPEGHQPVHTPSPHEGALSPDDVARRSFSTTFRGFDQHEVRGFLARVASELRMLVERERELRRRLDALEHQRPTPAPAAEPDEQQLINALGAEAARVIQAAREAAVEIRSKAEEHVGRLVREAQEEAGRVRSEAEQLLEVRTAEAEQAAEAIRSQAAQEADADLERARARGREMVAEAQAVRERLLRDLARRRRTAHAQIEQLRAGRDRLLDAYRVVRQTLEEATAELTRSEPEARAAAESAALRAAGEPEATVEEMEVELATARDNDLGSVFAPEPSEPAPSSDRGAAAADAPVPAAQREPAVPADAPPGNGAEGAPVEPAAATSAEATSGGAGTGPAASGYEESPAEERRSSLRLLRRRRAEQAAVESEGTVVEPADAVEGVRILRPPPRTEPAAEPAEAPDAPAASVPPGSTVPGEPAPAGEATSRASDEQAAGAVDDERRPASVEELFARIRAERAESVAQAEEVLARVGSGAEPAADTPAEAGEPAAPEGEGGAAALGEADDDSAASDTAGEDDATGAAGAGADEAVLEQRDARTEPIERQAARALKRALADEQNEVLDRLRRHSGAPTVDALLGGLADQTDRYARSVRDALVVAAAAGADLGGDESAAAGVDLDDLVTDGVAELAGGLRDRVGRLVEDAGEGGEQGLTMRLSSVYRELKTQRAEALVRDTVVAAFNRGVYAATPDGARLRWIVDFDGKPCPDGDDNALAGPLGKGEAFPTGQCLPPAHAGCRCVLVPDTA